jgi:hypothetical protein
MMADTIQNVGERYEVALPYQNDVEPFPESRSTVLHRCFLKRNKSFESFKALFTKKIWKIVSFNLNLNSSKAL